MMSAGVKIKLELAIVHNAGLPGIHTQALARVVMSLKNPDEFGVVNPLAFNPVALRAGGGRNLSFGGALSAVVPPWASLALGGAWPARMFTPGRPKSKIPKIGLAI